MTPRATSWPAPFPTRGPGRASGRVAGPVAVGGLADGRTALQGGSQRTGHRRERAGQQRQADVVAEVGTVLDLS